MKCAWLVAVLWVGPGMALSATVELKVGGAAQVVASPGGTLTVDVLFAGVEVDIDAFGGTLLASESHVLTVTARTWGPQGLGEYTVTPNSSLPWPLNPLSPDIGGFTWGSVTPPELDGIAVVTFTVKVAEGWGGQPLTLIVSQPLIVDHFGQVVPSTAVALTITSGAGCSDPPVLLSAESVRSHGGAGPFGVDLLAGGRVESRSGTVKVEAIYDMDVTVDGATASSGAPSASASGNKITVDVAGAANNEPLVIEFMAVNGACETPTALCVRLAAGDVNGDGSVNVLDLVAVRNNLNQEAVEATFRADVNADGAVNVLDLVAVRNNLNQAVAGCP